jgi:O-succinylbenzoic acid--CoA ligase
MQVEAWLRRAERTAPAAVAIETPDAQLSYAQLWRAATHAARELTERGARRGEPVAIALLAGIDFAVALHACMLLGSIAVPLDLRLTAAERERTWAGAQVLVDAPLVGARSVGTPSAASAAVTASADTHDLDAVCAVIHTSGTTSAPRAVELTYGNLLWSAIGSGVALGVDPHERWLCTLPLAHVGGLSILLRSAIYGTTAVIHERFETVRVLAGLREDRITLVSLVSTTLARLLDAGLCEPPALRHALTGGGPVPAALVERARAAGVPVTATYGLTEACSQVSTGGAPLFCTRVRIAHESLGRSEENAGRSEENGAGEILVAGPTVAPASVGADGWLHTGDLGRLDGAGNLCVVGRAAETIVSGGENVSPSEVEAVIEEHPGVLEAAVLGREDEQWGEAVTAIVVPRAGPLDEAAVRAHCAQRLAAFKVPKRVTFRTAPLPRTRSGKLLRREL